LTTFQMRIKMMSRKIVGLLSVFLIGLISCKPAELTIEEDIVDEPDKITWSECSYQIGDHACNLEFEDQNGDLFSLYDYIGQPVILDFSTMWCGYCQVAAAEVPAVQSKYNSEGLVYVTILVEDQSGNPATVENCSDWASLFGIVDSPVLAGDRSVIDPSGQTGVALSGWPTFLFIDRDMRVSSGLRGYSSQALDQEIQGIIAKDEQASE
jgi:thiol-disulfide isomerase/thioredoxin